MTNEPELVILTGSWEHRLKWEKIRSIAFAIGSDKDSGHSIYVTSHDGSDLTINVLTDLELVEKTIKYVHERRIPYQVRFKQ
ncbi:hypothetical protein SEA_GIBBLES_46 [Gordonia phage Gibbles]|nr:hypothetical protein SEA_GIBBLES_46 [Gordonia phage Gibbles]